ncbi:MAG: hypothetical protein BWY91_02573 [bacterium ADurb.BinA028]|nr:MAG: hypothetical protein BWY91_02573 [bacterium ADurb.BinA028]
MDRAVEVARGVGVTGGTVHDGAVPVRTLGVGSNRTQPAPGKYSSGQEWASPAVTVQRPPSWLPGRKPMATRAGIPAARDIITMAEVNCTQ